MRDPDPPEVEEVEAAMLAVAAHDIDERRPTSGSWWLSPATLQTCLPAATIVVTNGDEDCSP